MTTCRRGFTFVELMIGMVVTAVVLSALSVFTAAVAAHWETTEAGQSAFLSASLSVDRVSRIVRAAKFLDPAAATGSLDNSTPPAACMCWARDANNDGKMQPSELGLFAYDAASASVLWYTVQYPAGWTPARVAVADAPLSPAVLPTPAAFLSNPYAAAVPVAHHVVGCQLIPQPVTGPGQRPGLEVVLQVDTGRSQTLVYSTATLRGPNGAPN